MANPVVHFEIGCDNLEATKEFYAKTFGWDITHNGSSAIIDTKVEGGISGHITALGHEPHKYINIYIEVEDIDKSIQDLEKNGGELMIGPIELPDKKKFAWFTDNAGNTVGLITKVN